MKLKLLVIALFVQFTLSAQIDANSLFGLPSATTTDINNIDVTTIQEGALVFDTNQKMMFQFDGTNWVALSQDISRSIVLNRSLTGNNGLLVNATNTYFDFPLDLAHQQVNTGNTFEALGNGEVRVETAGVYLLSASLSTSNMPAGDTKYIIGAFLNDNLIGYLTRGFASLPNTDWWGASGILIYNLNANDRVKFRYVINNNGTPLHARFLNIGITKI